MANMKGPTEGGHAKGHSNVCHWNKTEDIKRQMKRRRRIEGKEMCKHTKIDPKEEK